MEGNTKAKADLIFIHNECKRFSLETLPDFCKKMLDELNNAKWHRNKLIDTGICASRSCSR